MAEKDVNQRQIVINLHTGETGKTESLANKLNLGELAVEHVSGENARLHVLRGDGTVGTFIESADTFNAISAATVDVLGQVEAMGFALSADLRTLSGSVVSDYALSSVTHTEIETAKETVIGQSGDTASADTIYGSKAYTDARIDEVVAGSVTGVTGANYIEAAVVDHNIHVSADTQAMATADADNKGLAEASDVKTYVDNAKDAAISSAASYTDTEINTLSGVAHTEIVSAITESKEYTDDQIDALSSATETAIATAKQEAIDTASGYTDTQISNLKGDATASGDTLGKLEDRIDAIEEGGVGVQTVSKKEEGGDGDYITITVDNTDAQNPVLSVDDTIQAVATADASDDTKKGLAEASDVKTYVDAAEADAVAAASAYTNQEINTLSGNTHTEIEAAKGWASGYTNQEINTLSGNLTTMIEGVNSGSEIVISAYTGEGQVTSGYLKTYEIFQGDASVGKIDIPKDLVVNSGGTIEIGGEKYIRLYIANDPEHPIDIPVADLAHVYTEGDGISIDDSDVISAVVDTNNANGLSVGTNGIAMALATSGASGAMSAADKAKLDGIEADADVNVLEGVQVNGADLTIDGDKKVNVTVTSGSANGTIAVNGADVDVTGLESAAFVTVESLNTTASGYAVSAKEEVIGQNGDSASADTIYGAKAYTDAKVDAVIEGALTGATGDSLVNAVDSGNTVFVSATQDLTDAVAKANSALQSIAATGDSYVSATADSISSITVTTTVADLTGTTDGLVDAADAREYIANAVSAESVTRETADEALSDRIAALEAESGKTESALQSISAVGDSYVNAVADTISSITVTTVTGTVAGNEDKLAVASDVKGYVDGEVSGLSGNLITYTDTEIETLSGNVIGNAESTSADTTILGVKAYVDEKVAEKNVNATGDTYVIASADSNTVHVEASQAVKDAADGAVLSVTSGNTANVTISNHEIDFNHMIIDCGTY